ncbi:Fph type histidine kinase [Boletus reticuloceps]|uniref:dolichol kinase n=1 Tax=Boletus reticuloceps TaxID=495285 RepID=A0A8I3A6E4_9AGAM|nr:Fph type histidine kinase [Boletus reticuloceps]
MQGHRDTAGEDTDDGQHLDRGRCTSLKSLRRDMRDTARKKKQQISPSRNTSSPVFAEHASEQRTNGTTGRGQSFTRSRSPHIRAVNSSGQSPHQTTSTPISHARHRTPPTSCALLPGEISIHVPIPFSGILWSFSADARSLAESILLLGSLLYANRKLALALRSLHLTPSVSSEIDILVVTCIIYVVWSHSSFVKTAPTPPPSDVDDAGAPSPRIESRESKRTGGPRSSQNRTHFGFVWMSVPKNFRDCLDDGALTGLSFAPLISVALLCSSLHQAASPNPTLLPPDWLIEAPRVLGDAHAPLSALNAQISSRRSLVDYATLCSFILLVQIFSSWWYEARYRRGRNVPEGERGSVPRSEAQRTWTYWMYSYALTLVALFVRYLLASNHIGLWQNLNYFDIILGSVFFQFCLYIALRLAHGGLTLGELALVCFGGLSLGTELLNLTRAHLWPNRTPFIRTYRLPTPLLIFQVALIAGSLLTGFLLSPLLALSRHIAQRPVRRLRFPDEKPRHQRALAVGFYVGTIVIVAGLIGPWTWLCLGKRDPWLWAIYWVLQGKRKWTRPLLLGYWALLGSISVAGWNRQLSRTRRYKSRNPTSNSGDNGSVSTPTAQTQKPAEPVIPAVSPAAGLGLGFANLPNLPNLPNGTQVATDLLDAANKHVPTLSVNARRKFFHGLAVVMFLPGMAVDPAFGHLSFSAAFALFIFAEYVRYFAIYPFGAAVHLFMNEFLDYKDRGTAILSHFYLLTGCAGSVWLEGPSRILVYTGILVLGVGDALASIVGKRFGRYRWSASSSKTVEGSVAFAVSVVACAWVLRVLGLTERFSMIRYGVVTVLSSVLEALSEQNDNLTLPLYMWSMLVVAEYVSSSPCSLLSPCPHVIMPIPDNEPPTSFPLLHDPSFQMPFQLFQNAPYDRVRRPSRPASASAIDGPFFVLPTPSVPSNHDPLVCSTAVSQPTVSIPPIRTDGDISDYPPRSDTMSDGSVQTTDPRSQTTPSDYDWVSFMTAYAAGQWNPHRTPHPPRSVFDSTWPSMHASSSDLPAFPSPIKSSQSGPPSSESLFPGHSVFLSPSSDTANDKDATTPLTVSPEKHFTKLPPPPASLIGRRFRKSFNDLRQTTSHTMQLSLDSTQNLTTAPDVTTAAATMRWAAARVNISPLALPSPEHELTDPMRGVHAAIPGVHASECSPPLNPCTPGSNRKTRLGSFWEGTQDVGDDVDKLSTIQGSGPASPVRFTPEGDTRPLVDSTWSTLIPPASAPLPRQSPEEQLEEDYFTASSSRANTMDADLRPTPDVPSIWQEFASARRESEPLDFDVASTPALPRRMCLTRQTSSPLPISIASERKLPGGRSVSETVSSYRIGRAAKEEQMFLELGYLVPPNPPDELERRRALYKFNIWNTAPDINFDRIAHLVKLVFNTKSVFISLIDGTEQWFKSQCGISFMRCPRLTSFCAHSILQRCDEPTVILDTQTDWRFAKNPFVIGSPHTRFYAGAPLRTQEGYNIGSLALIDDSPRQDFSPRQRHTLKEFAAIVMREMELWRDKIQLRIRDKIQTSMEQFSRECLEIDQQESQDTDTYASVSMDKVYDRAAKLVKRTLDVEEVLVMDVSHCDVRETLSAEATVSVVMHHGGAQTRASSRTLTADEQSKLSAFFEQYPDGKISEGILPVCFRPFIPTHIQYALTVPVFNIDKRPFALICAYNASDPSRRFLEGHELSYLRAIGVIILSAVLKRRMMLADQAKSLFISKLVTLLHSILAAAELLADTSLNYGQMSFLHTVQACGTSLVETVNHVLDFTKLSGNMKSGGVENVITRTRVDLEQLVEEAIDGSWIGFCARHSSEGSEIGSVYAPNPNQRASSVMTAPESSQHVEIIVDIDHCEGGWIVKCDKGGIRRVLMNLFGNSLKFTTSGYIHVSLKQISTPEDMDNTVKIELRVSDTGKGISQNFLQNHLFRPFSQENPLQAGTGLGLAIVSSIVRSPSVSGKVEVVSSENVGTDIKVIFEAEISEEDSSNIQDPFFFDDQLQPPVISFLGFKKRGRGAQLLSEVLRKYSITWWGFTPQREDAELGDIVILNEDPSPVVTALEKMDNHRSFIILSSSRGSPRIMELCNAYENNGGFCRVVHKPGGPFRFRTALKQLLRARQRRQHRLASFTNSGMSSEESVSLQSTIADDYSEPNGSIDDWPDQPTLLYTGISGVAVSISPDSEMVFKPADGEQTVNNSTLVAGAGGTLLKTPVGSVRPTKPHRKVLVVEDNNILRSLLAKWLTKKGLEHCEAVDGRHGVEVFQAEGPFDVVLLDLSMPVLDGVGATVEIRQIERARSSHPSSVILALTGMSSLEDKRKAFEAGMDGYLVKPVAFRTLDDMFHKLGLT